jgi:threonine aldolase
MRTWTGRPADLDLIRAMFAPPMGPFFVATRAVSVENTHNFGGGTVIDIDELRELRAFADDRGVGVHVDGARIWNAHVATGTPLADYGSVADVLAVCLSKGLGAPVGSLIVGARDVVDEARVWRKRLGGGMRQVGVLAAAGIYALDYNVERLVEDHDNARLLAEACGVSAETNIVVVDGVDAPGLVEAARSRGVLVSAVGPSALRMVTHLDVSRADAQSAAAVLSELVGA